MEGLLRRGDEEAVLDLWGGRREEMKRRDKEKKEKIEKGKQEKKEEVEEKRKKRRKKEVEWKNPKKRKPKGRKNEEKRKEERLTRFLKRRDTESLEIKNVLIGTDKVVLGGRHNRAVDQDVVEQRKVSERRREKS